MEIARFFDCHSHWGTAKAHIFRTPEQLSSQQRIWGTPGRYWDEQEMIDYMRASKARVILDLSWIRDLPMEEIKEFHDYAYALQRANPDVIFGHWLQFNPNHGEAALKEFRRGLDAKAGFIGFSVSGQATGVPAADPVWDPFYKLSIEANAPVLMTVGLTGIGQGVAGGRGRVLDDGHPRHLDRVAARYPELRILAARPAYPWQEEMLAVLTHKANVSYELHGWSARRFEPNLKKQIAGRMQDRIMVGCDFPVLSYDKVIETWVSEDYSQEILNKVFYQNAERYFSTAASEGKARG
jgi:predicted TIM-barrel fold metal-dependent hydrolase